VGWRDRSSGIWSCSDVTNDPLPYRACIAGFPSFLYDGILLCQPEGVATAAHKEILKNTRGGAKLIKDPLLEQDTTLREVVDRLVEALRPRRVYLFGSRARGDSGPGSDLDVLVLVERPQEPLYRLAQRGYRALRGVSAAVDVVVWEWETFDARRHLKASFPATVEREGRLLYVA